jgi:hypothetical protein
VFFSTRASRVQSRSSRVDRDAVSTAGCRPDRRRPPAAPPGPKRSPGKSGGWGNTTHDYKQRGAEPRWLCAPPDYKFKVYTAGQKRRVTPQIKREFKRRAAIEPVIGHLKEHHRMGRNHLAHASGDAINAVLAAAGYNFRRLLLLRILIALGLAAQEAIRQTPRGCT